MNQCDGCRAGLPIVNGIHTSPNGWWDAMRCQAYRYPTVPPDNGAAATRMTGVPATPTDAAATPQCATCEGEGIVAQDFGINAKGPAMLVPCPDCHAPNR